MSKKKIFPVSFSVVLLLFMMWPLQGQINNTLFFMHGVPQANRINPAIQPKCGFYLGFPMAAPLRAEVASSSLAYKDIIYYDSSIDSLITFLHPLGDKQAFINQLKPLNFVVSDLGTSLASLGFRTNVGFFSFDITTRIDGNLYYPGDLARLILQGADEGVTYSLDGIGMDLSVFDEISLGWSGNILDNLQVGARAKMLFGIANLATKESKLSVTPSQDAWHLQSDIVLNASVPFAEFHYNQDGRIDSLSLKNDVENLNPFAIPRYMFNFSNFGMGLDIGINYRPLDQLLVSASVTDIGFISWKDEVQEVSYRMEYDFKGLEVNPFELSDDYSFGDFIDSSLTVIGDSLYNFLVTRPGDSYSKRLNTKLYIGASYFLTPKINFGLLSRTDFLNGKISEQVTASANLTTGRFINLTLSYSYINSYYKNFGAGISFNAGPLNMYVISDNGLNAVFWPEEARSVNLWFGLNLVFGYRQFMQEAFRDKPLIY